MLAVVTSSFLPSPEPRHVVYNLQGLFTEQEYNIINQPSSPSSRFNRPSLALPFLLPPVTLVLAHPALVTNLRICHTTPFTRRHYMGNVADDLPRTMTPHCSFTCNSNSNSNNT